MRIAILTANTEIYREQEEDKAGKVIREIVEAAGHQVVFAKALPLDKKVLSTIMQRMADGQMADLILTTGGAGLAQGDCTPEATLEVVDREIRGIPEAMRAHMMTLTKRSMLNRAAAGVRNNVMIVNLPGKAGAVKECLEYLLPEIIHGVEEGIRTDRAAMEQYWSMWIPKGSFIQKNFHKDIRRRRIIEWN